MCAKSPLSSEIAKLDMGDLPGLSPATKEPHGALMGSEATEFSLLYFLLMFWIFLVLATRNMISGED